MKKTLTLITLVMLLVQCKSYDGQEVIDLRGKHLWVFPHGVLKNTSATELHLGAKGYTVYPPMSLIPDGKTGIRKIPEKIAQMITLERFSITASKIKSLPEGLTTLPRLHYLDLSFNKKLDLGAEISKIDGIKNLDTLVVYGLMMTESLKTELKNLKPGLTIIDETQLMHQQ